MTSACDGKGNGFTRRRGGAEKSGFSPPLRVLRVKPFPFRITRNMNALPLILFFLAVTAIGYRYYSAFLAAKVMALAPGLTALRLSMTMIIGLAFLSAIRLSIM